MNEDLLLEIMKHDELVTEIKKSVLDHIARQNAILKLNTKRESVIDRRNAYNARVKKEIQRLDHQIFRIDREAKDLYKLIDEYDDEIEEAPRFTKECIDLLIKFCDEYKENE